MRLALTALCVFALAGCSNLHPDPAPESDAGVIDDGGVISDAGTEADAGITLSVDGGSGGPNDPPPGTIPAPGSNAADPCASNATFSKGSLFRSIDSAGGLRWYYLYVPEGYTPTPKELVINIHGYTSDPLQQALLSKMNDQADARNFLVVYPAGINRSWNAGQCCGDTAWVTHVDDVQFISDLIDAVSREFCIDKKRVFATGMSNGGFLSHRLACELDNKIAAIAPVAGVMGIPDCSPTRDVPVFHFHGTSDPLVPYFGGGPMGFPSVAATMGGWRIRNGCGFTEKTTYEKGDSKCVTWNNCENGANETALCTVDGGGHTWPGGMPVPPLGYTTTDLDATKMMLDFFERHPMP